MLASASLSLHDPSVHHPPLADRYAAAIFGQSPRPLDQPKLAVCVISPDGRLGRLHSGDRLDSFRQCQESTSTLAGYHLGCCTPTLPAKTCQRSCPSLGPVGRAHSLTPAARKGKGSTGHRCGLRGLLDSLGAAAGDTLCFEPAGALTARVTLIKVAAAAAGVAGSPGGRPAEQQLVEDDQEEGGEEDAMEVDAEAEGWEAEPQQAQQARQAQHSPAAGAESVAAEAAGGSGSGTVPSQQAVQQQEASTLWDEVCQLLEMAEEHGER